MTEQSNNNNSSGAGNPNGSPGAPNPNRRPNNRRRHHNNNRPRDGAPQEQQSPQAQNPNQRPGPNQPRPQGPGNQNLQNNNQNPNQKRRPQHNNNRPRPQGQSGSAQPHSNTNSTGLSVERIYEKYLNLLDQHIIARRKYHDLFFRADPPQKNKLERNFYNTLNDIREFENKLTPEMKISFEKRNNGYQYDRTYTSNHEIPIEGDEVPGNLPPAEPHYLQSQIAADYKEDIEESVGTAEDYLKYKNF
jgi:DNA mismatch repair ATPase MutL